MVQHVLQSPEVSHVFSRAITYKLLEERLQKTTSPGNWKRNRAALNSWKSHLNLNDEALVGVELQDNYVATRDSYLDHQKKRLGSGLANRRSALVEIHSVFVAMVEEEEASSESAMGVTTLAEAVQDVLKKTGMDSKEASKKFGFSYATVRYWMTGTIKSPSTALLSGLQAMETAAGKPGYLTRFIPSKSRCTPVADFSEHVDPYRTMFAEARGKSYWCNLNDPSFSHIKEAFDEFTRHMTCLLPDLERNKKWTQNRGKEFGSEDVMHNIVRAFFGFLTLPISSDPKHSGMDLLPSTVSFGMLGCYELVHRYWQFRAARMEIQDGLYTGGALALFSRFTQMTRPGTGWFFQTENRWLDQLRENLEHVAGFKKEEFKKGYFRVQYKIMLQWKKKVGFNHNLFRNRDPWVTLKPFLDADSPMERWIFPLIRNLVKDRPGAYASRNTQLTYERNLMIIVAFFAVPLRQINWVFCELGKNLYQVDGVWWLHITKEDFKNRAFCDRDFVYKLRLPEWAQPFFSHYVKSLLPEVPRDESGVRWLFPVIVGDRNRAQGSRLAQSSVIDVFAGIFKSYFGFAISTHAARHIVTTDYLKADPRNLIIVAVLLNDKPETVRREYARLFTQDYAALYDAFISVKASKILSLGEPGNTSKGAIE